jgi:ABC-type transporter Mla MlaB component
MLRITALNTPNQATLKLEGSLVGAWVLELEDAWRAASSDRLLCLDLTAVDQVDSAGKYLLVLLRERGVRLVASGLVMTETVAELVEQWHISKDQ